MNLNRRRSSRDETWGRVFALLIVLFVGLFFIDRFVGLDGLFQRIGTVWDATGTPTPTSTATVVYIQAEEYSFADPTEIPVTRTPQQTPTRTPTPVLPIDLITISDEENVERDPLWSVLAYCQEPYKTSRYVAYDLVSGTYRPVTDSIPYLVQSTDEIILALNDGLLQQGLSIDFLRNFSIPTRWRLDRQYAVLGIAENQGGVVLHRWESEGEGIYWLSQGSESLIKLLDLPHSLEESYTDRDNEWLFLRMIDAENVSNLFAVDLASGSMTYLTEFQSQDAFGGVLSSDGTQVAYWTADGVWVINLDGSFGALVFPEAEQPSWSPDGAQMVLVQNGYLKIGDLDFGAIANNALIGLPVEGQQPVWAPDGNQILYWKTVGQNCTLNVWNLTRNFSKEIFRTQNQICQSEEPIRWAPDFSSFLISLPATGVGDETSGDILCDLGTGECEFLRYTRGNYPCRSGQWTDYAFPYEWAFETRTENWFAVQQMSLLMIVERNILTRSTGAVPLINSPHNLNINADIYPFIEITMSVSGGSQAELGFVTVDTPRIDPANSFEFHLIPDGEMHRYVIDLREYSRWDGVINYIRLRPTDVLGAEIQIQSVRILSTVEEIN